MLCRQLVVETLDDPAFFTLTLLLLLFVQMFAREMQPGVVSWGNEVLKFQGGENFVRNVSGKLV